MGLVYAIAQLIHCDPNLSERLRLATTIELNYTSRIKNGRDQWVVQLRLENFTEALAHAEAKLDENEARLMLTKEAQNLGEYLRKLIPGFNAKITGYYFLGNRKKQKEYGQITEATTSSSRSE